MKSELDRSASFIDSLAMDRKVAFFVRLIYELTIAGRTCYSIDSKGLDNPVLLREINELQHRLAAHIMNMGTDGGYVRSSSDLAALFLEPNYNDELLRREIRKSFINAITGSLKDKKGSEDKNGSGLF